MLHYLLGLTRVALVGVRRAWSATHSTSVEKLEARQIQPRLGIARRSMSTLTSAGAPLYSPSLLSAHLHIARGPTRLPQREKCVSSINSSSISSATTTEPTPFPYSISLVSRQQCQEEAPRWEAQGDVADADGSPTHHSRTNVVLSCL